MVLFVTVTFLPITAFAQSNHRLPEIRFSVQTSSTSNPFNLRDAWRNNFDNLRTEANRLDGFESTSDVVSQFSLRTQKTWRKGHGRRLEAEILMEYNLYSQNRFANYGRIRAAGSYRSRSVGKSTLRLTWIPNRQRKNYQTGFDSLRVFLPADYRESDAKFSQQFEFAFNLETELFVRYGRRTYDPIFSNRDRTEFETGLGFDQRVKKGMHVLVHGSFGKTNTGDQLEEGIATDRSRNSYEVGAELVSNLPGGDGSFSVVYREREYTTNEVRDTSHFKRKDRRWKFAAKWRTRISKRIRVWLEGDYADNRSNRVTISIDPDIVPYSRYSVGTGISLDLN